MGSGRVGWPAGRKLPNTAILVIGISAIVLVVIIIAMIATCRSPARSLGINAEVTFDGTQFVISNKDDFDWTNVKVEVNGGVVFPGFSYSIPKIVSQQSYTVLAGRFFKPDGSKFDPSTIEIQRFIISCDTPKGTGSWSSNWQ